MPEYQTAGSACFDLASVDEAFVPPGRAVTVSTGLAFEIPEGHVMLIYSRSGHGFKHGLRLGNCTGVIDSDYRGEVRVRLHNDGSAAFEVMPGDRVAQGMIIKRPAVRFEEASDLSETERGAGGFGSTGTGQREPDYPESLSAESRAIYDKVLERVGSSWARLTRAEDSDYADDLHHADHLAEWGILQRRVCHEVRDNGRIIGVGYMQYRRPGA